MFGGINRVLKGIILWGYEIPLCTVCSHIKSMLKCLVSYYIQNLQWFLDWIHCILEDFFKFQTVLSKNLCSLDKFIFHTEKKPNHSPVLLWSDRDYLISNEFIVIRFDLLLKSSVTVVFISDRLQWVVMVCFHFVLLVNKKVWLLYWLV